MARSGMGWDEMDWMMSTTTTCTPAGLLSTDLDSHGLECYLDNIVSAAIHQPRWHEEKLRVKVGEL